MAGQGTNYFANHIGAPQILQGTPNYNVEMGEGINPPGEFYPAHYLPTCISENRIGGSYYVLMPGKVISLDSNKRLIGSGLAKDFLNQTATPGSHTIKYGANDTVAGMTDANGGIIQVDNYVADAMISAGLGVTDPIGIMRYSSLMAPGTDPSDPSTFWRHQYDTGGARAFSRWGYIQVPIVETNVRREDVTLNATDWRIALYSDGSGVTFYINNTAVTGIAQVANMKAYDAVSNKQGMTYLTSGNPTQFAVIGRTIFFNAPAPANLNIRYTPKLDLPFTSLVSAGSTSAPITTATEWGLAKYIGQKVTYDLGSNFKLAAGGDEILGRILDVKVGSSKDLALVRTYYRDMGLWQEQPGSATDGRNAILSIANAPMYIARIAVQFNVPLFK